MELLLPLLPHGRKERSASAHSASALTMTTPPNTAPTRRKSQVIHLRHGDDAQVSIEPEDENRFVLEVQSAVEQLTAGATFVLQVQEALKLIGEWISDRSEVVKRAVLALEGTSFSIFMVHSGEYDPEFEDQMSELETAIVCNDGGLRMISHMQAIAFYGGFVEELDFVIPRNLKLLWELKIDGRDDAS